MLSDVEIVMGALPALRAALRPRIPGAASGVGLSDHQLRILGYLDEDDPAMVGELAEALHVTPSTMSLNLKRLEGGGFLTRTRDPADRRVMNVRLSEHGRRALEAVPEFDPGRVDALLLGLRPGERRRAIDGLSILADAAHRLRARGDEYVNALVGREAPPEGETW